MPIYSLLFRNRWFALIWAGLTLLSVVAFAGKDGGATQIGQSIDQLKAKRAALAKDTTAAPVIVGPARVADRPRPAYSALEALPGSDADPRDPQVGEVFVNPVTSQRFRAVRGSDLRVEAASRASIEQSDTAAGTVL